MKFANWALYVLQVKSKYPYGHSIHDAIPTILSSDRSTGENISKLEKLPQAVVLSIDPVRGKLSQTFLHQTSGVGLIEDRANVVGICGYDRHTCFPVEFDAGEFFSFTEPINTPSLHSFLSLFQIHEADDLDDIITSNADADKVRVGRVCVLPPELAEVAITNHHATPKELLLLFLKKIMIMDFLEKQWEIFKIKIPNDKTFDELSVNEIYTLAGKPPPTDGKTRIKSHLANHVDLDTDSTAEGDDSADEKTTVGVAKIEFAMLYLPILRTLWLYYQHKDSVGTVTVNRTPIVEHDDLDWFKEKLELFLLPENDSKRTFSDDNTSLSSEIRHLAQTITNDRHQRFASEGEEDSSSNSGKKKWSKLEETYKKTILFASTKDGRSAAQVPSDRCISLLTAGSAPVVSRLIRSWHNSTDIIVQAGMATNLGKGILTSFPTAFDINTFSPLFTPPSIAGFQDISNTDEAKLELSMRSSQGLLDHQKSQITFTKEYVPTECHILVKQLENFYIILCDLLTKEAFICESLLAFIDTFKINDMIINRSFQANPFFSAWALNTVHFKIQSFLHACSSAEDITDLNLFLYTFENEIQAIVTQQTHLFVKPTWFEAQKRDLDHQDKKESGGGKQQVVFNPSVDPSIRVANGNVLHALTTNFVPNRNIAAFKGQEICHKFHLLGKCHSQCRRAVTHRSLPAGVHSYYKKQVLEMMRQLDRKNNTANDDNSNQSNYETNETSQQTRQANRNRFNRNAGERS